MKNIFKPFLTVLIVGTLLFSVVSCKNDTDEDDKDVSIVFKATIDGGETFYKFYSDKTFIAHAKYSDVQSGFSISMDLDGLAGTYTGEPSKDGVITLTKTKEIADLESTVQVLFIAALQRGETSISITNKEAPLKSVTPETKTITISGGTFTVIDDDGESVTYTRQ